MSFTAAEKAAKAKAFLEDPVIAEIFEDLRSEAHRKAFARDSNQEAVTAERHAVWALEDIKARLQNLIDDVMIAGRRNSNGRAE